MISDKRAAPKKDILNNLSQSDTQINMVALSSLSESLLGLNCFPTFTIFYRRKSRLFVATACSWRRMYTHFPKERTQDCRYSEKLLEIRPGNASVRWLPIFYFDNRRNSYFECVDILAAICTFQTVLISKRNHNRSFITFITA